MRKIILFLFLFLCNISFGQIRLNDDEYFTVSVIADPITSSEKNGICLGGELEYVGTVYVRTSITRLEASGDDSYTTFVGAFGLNLTYGYFSKFRYYTGARLGTIKRKKANAMVGAELGVDYLINDNFFVGLRGTLDHYSDNEFYQNSNKIKPNSFFRIGITF